MNDVLEISNPVYGICSLSVDHCAIHLFALLNLLLLPALFVTFAPKYADSTTSSYSVFSDMNILVILRIHPDFLLFHRFAFCFLSNPYLSQPTFVWFSSRYVFKISEYIFVYLKTRLVSILDSCSVESLVPRVSHRISEAFSNTSTPPSYGIYSPCAWWLMFRLGVEETERATGPNLVIYVMSLSSQFLIKFIVTSIAMEEDTIARTWRIFSLHPPLFVKNETK